MYLILQTFLEMVTKSGTTADRKFATINYKGQYNQSYSSVIKISTITHIF